MRRVIASTFVSLDGVMQAPGGPEEDRTGGFSFGGWMFCYESEDLDISSAGFDGRNRELLLGRRTYEIFEAYWPYQSSDDPIASTFNATRKYVASRTLKEVNWYNSTLLHGDVADAVAALKLEEGADLQIIGSGELIQTLHSASLIDEYNIWIFPLVLGEGKRLFPNTIHPRSLKLIRSKLSESGVIMTTYVPVGEVQVGSYVTTEPSERELIRRKRISSGSW